MRKSTLFLILSLSICFVALSGTPGMAFTEPIMADYTAVPVFSNQSVTPNVMIILDNSGSMNFNAYGTYPGDYGTVSDMPFTGEPYSQERTFQISSSQDDAEEGVASGSYLYYYNGDLDLGGFGVSTNDAIMGLRFQNVAIPKGAVIQAAYIEFMSNRYNDEITNILIEGEAIDDPPPFETLANNLKTRNPTTATVDWTNVPTWNAGVAYPTADISEIVQEIVDRAGWVEGNAMVFRFSSLDTGPNKRDARPYDANPSTAPKLHVVFSGPTAATRYYGYFNPNWFYTFGSTFTMKYKKVAFDYGSNKWSVEDLSGSAVALNSAAVVSEKLWDGNWLNWLCMRRVDVLRKVLMGGLATARTGGGNQINYGEVPAQVDRVFSKKFDSSFGTAVSPYNGNYVYRMEGGRIYVEDTSDYYNIRIQKDSDYEPEEFVDGNLAGVLQKVGNKARWGNIWFNGGTGSNQSGGTVEHTMGTNMTTMVTDLQNTAMDTWTPLAETFYVAMQYFKQEDPASGLDYPNSAVPNANVGDDPYYNGTEFVPCAKSFVILLTDGASTKDALIPSTYKDYDGDGKELATCDEDYCNYPNGGSDFLDDLALYARTVDLRADLEGDQNLILYAIHAFDKDPNATSLLSDAARNGGFDDINDNDKPDLVEEYDQDKDGWPDTFFEADDGYAIEAKLLAAITDILKRASSGTAASVLATNSEGEGTMLQAYFRPRVDQGVQEAFWYGYMHSLWVDSLGNLHEDTNENKTFDEETDLQVSFTLLDNQTAYIKNGNTYLLDNEDLSSKLKPVFEVGELLMLRDPNTRKIFTYVDNDNDGAVDETALNPFDSSGELIAFTALDAKIIQPFLGVRDDLQWGDSGADLGSTQADRAENIITWVRGSDVAGLRNRTLDGVTWRLGDIIDSTPVTVTKPPERFHLWYADESYRTFYDAFKDRESVIYVGANDGMLHAFTSWWFDVENKRYVNKGGVSETLGDEIWAFIPQAVLPHLKWIAHADYTHTFLVDAKPRIFDAKILPDDEHYSDGDADDNWGTIMVMGMNMGAKQISVNEDFNDGTGVVERVFYPSYVCMDITEPRNPRVLWERSYADQAMSRSAPIPVKVGEKWFLVFGSGPTEYDGTSAQSGYIFVVDMKTGDLLRKFGPYDKLAFFSTAAAFDKNLNYNVDAIYIGDAYFSGKWMGGLYKIAVPCISNCEWDSTYDPSKDIVYDGDPANWIAHKIFTSGRPITAAPTLSAEYYPDANVDNVWIHFGTGRYLAESDKTTTNQDYLYGIKDPFFNYVYDGTFEYDYANAATKTIAQGDLFASDDITVTTGGKVLDGTNLFNSTGEFKDLIKEVRTKWDGWYRLLETSGSVASERMISKPAVFGGMAFFPAFTPDTDICKGEGTTNFYAVYYTTGTGYTKQILGIENPTTITFNDNGTTVTQEVVAVKLENALMGAPPPSVGLHTGREQGGKAYLQVSTGVVEEITIGTAVYSLSAITEWWDRVDQP